MADLTDDLLDIAVRCPIYSPDRMTALWARAEIVRLRAEVADLRVELEKWDVTATCQVLSVPNRRSVPSDVATVTCRTPDGVYVFEVPTAALRLQEDASAPKKYSDEWMTIRVRHKENNDEATPR